MNFSRCLAAAVCLLVSSLAARANLFVVYISTRTYTLSGSEITFRPGAKNQFVNIAAQNSSLDAKTLVLVYDTVADALEVVRKDDGSLISTVMTFTNGIDIQNTAKTRAFRQAFITLSGTDSVGGSVAGPVSIAYDHLANIIAFRWNGDFQYGIPGDSNTLERVVKGRFTLGREIHVKAP